MNFRQRVVSAFSQITRPIDLSLFFLLVRVPLK